jgi:hypothetical protein
MSDRAAALRQTLIAYYHGQPIDGQMETLLLEICTAAAEAQPAARIAARLGVTLAEVEAVITTYQELETGGSTASEA